MRNKTNVSTVIFYAVAIITAGLAIFFAVIMTEAGQFLNIPREWMIGYYSNKWTFIVLNLVFLALLWFLNIKYNIWRKLWMYLASLGVVISIISANFLMPIIFPTSQYTANYVSITEADKILEDDSIIYAVEINGEAKGYPRKHLELPHVAGANIGGEEVAMTFCGLSNLPIVYEQSMLGGKSKLGVLSQTHNNLLMVEMNSGELIQQITATTEFSKKKLKTYPNTMMSWKSFKSLYPKAEVFIHPFERPLDTVLRLMLAGPTVQQFSEEYGPAFPTLSLKDHRLTNKDQVWGLDAGSEQAAFSKSFFEKNPIYSFSLGGGEYVIVYDSEYDVVNLFNRSVDGKIIEVTEIDRNGQTPTVKLKKEALHNGIFWMIWVEWFPDTKVFKAEDK
jgi:hypothetical protein